MEFLHPKTHLKLLLVTQLFTVFAASSVVVWAEEGNAEAPRAVNGPPSYDTKGRIPGDPDNAIHDLEHIYHFISLYRGRHGGRFPETNEIVKEILSEPTAYNYKSEGEVKPFLTNPDALYSDYLWMRTSEQKHANVVVVYSFFKSRPDGTPVGGPKAAGTRDVLAFTPIYSHVNIKHLADQTIELNPVGYNIVLWDDGKIDKIPYDLNLSYFRPDDRIVPVYPGQAGVPADCLSYDEIWSRAATKSLLRGKPVVEPNLEPVADNGAPEALISLSRLLGKPIDREKMWSAISPAQVDFSLNEIQSKAGLLGLALRSSDISLDRLRENGVPAIIHVSELDRLVTLATCGKQLSVIYDRGTMKIVDNKTLADRYHGEALTLSHAPEEAASIKIEDPVRVVNMPSTQAEVSQQISIVNGGREPIALEIERPLCGVSKAELSTDTVPPGGTVVLNLTFKWRSMLKGNTQSTTVTLRTSDPMRPRAQLGFQLELPRG